MARIAPSATRQRQPRQTSPRHLAYLRKLPCLMTGSVTDIEAAHIRYGDPHYGKRPTGMGERPDDRYAVPLCAAAHRTGPDAQHGSGERAWWERQGIDPLAIAAALWECSGDIEEGRRIVLTRLPGRFLPF